MSTLYAFAGLLYLLDLDVFQLQSTTSRPALSQSKKRIFRKVWRQEIGERRKDIRVR
jgi:hypothetical protein